MLSFIQTLYSLSKPIIYKLDAETAHDLSLRTADRLKFLTKCIQPFKSDILQVKAFGLDFESPIGLAAGYTKNAEALPFLSNLGFGHLEVGTVTPKAQFGNDKPRVFRYTSLAAVINRLGFPSKGATEVKQKIIRDKQHINNKCLLGINIGKNKETQIEDAFEDYIDSFKILNEFADYVSINISSPNTPDLRKLQEPKNLSKLINAIEEVNNRKLPLLVKLSPDIEKKDLTEILEVILSFNSIKGIIATNTTVSRDTFPLGLNIQGGLSGAPLRYRSLNFIKDIYKTVSDRISIVGVGGISSCEEVLETIKAGATLVQIYTALIFKGPSLVNDINIKLDKYMRDNRITSLEEIRGTL